MRANDFPDTTEEQLLVDWQDIGQNGCHEIRSHRRPRSTRRGPLALLAVAVATSLGITLTAYVTQPTTSAAVAGGEFITPTDEVDAFIERLQVADAPPASRTERKPTTVPKKVRTPSRTSAAPKKVAPRAVTPVAGARITSCFGPRWGSTHKGMDFAAPAGRKIVAVVAGKIVQAGARFSGLGNSVVVDHGDGSMTLYGHASRVLVRTGQLVSAGDLVALVGSTGNSTGNHLHFGLAKTRSLSTLFDRLINPAPWLHARGVNVGSCG